MATIGNTDETSPDGDRTLDGFVRAIPITVPGAGVIPSISAYVADTNISAEHTCKFALYDASSNLIAETEVINPPAGPSWQTANFASPVSVTAADYFLAATASGESGDLDLFYHDATNAGRDDTTTVMVFEDPAVGWATSARAYLLYATYTPTASASPFPIFTHYYTNLLGGR